MLRDRGHPNRRRTRSDDGRTGRGDPPYRAARCSRGRDRGYRRRQGGPAKQGDDASDADRSRVRCCKAVCQFSPRKYVDRLLHHEQSASQPRVTSNVRAKNQTRRFRGRLRRRLFHDMALDSLHRAAAGRSLAFDNRNWPTAVYEPKCGQGLRPQVCRRRAGRCWRPTASCRHPE